MCAPCGDPEALGELVGAAREGLLALSVGVGLGVVHELIQREVKEVVGPTGEWNLDRTARPRSPTTASGQSARLCAEDCCAEKRLLLTGKRDSEGLDCHTFV